MQRITITMFYFAWGAEILIEYTKLHFWWSTDTGCCSIPAEMGPGRGRKQSRPPKGELRIVRAGSTEGDVIGPRDFPHFSQRESTPTSHSVLKRHCKRLEGAEFQLTEEVPVLSKLYEVGEETFSAPFGPCSSRRGGPPRRGQRWK